MTFKSNHFLFIITSGISSAIGDVLGHQRVQAELIARCEWQITQLGKLLIVLFIKSRFIVLAPVSV